MGSFHLYFLDMKVEVPQNLDLGFILVLPPEVFQFSPDLAPDSRLLDFPEVKLFEMLPKWPNFETKLSTQEKFYHFYDKLRHKVRLTLNIVLVLGKCSSLVLLVPEKLHSLKQLQNVTAGAKGQCS